MRKCFGLTLICVLIAISGEGRAADDVKEAKKAFKEGVQLFKQELYKEAADSFRKANEIKFNWKVLFNIGQCEAASKRYGVALEAFEQYLARGGDEIPPNRQEEVIREAKRLRELVGSIEVKGLPGATIYVDNFPRGETPLLGPISISSGISHEIRAELAGETIYKRNIRVGSGTQKTIELKEKEEPPPAESAEETTAEPAPSSEEEPILDQEADKGRELKIVGWSMLGGGAALLIAGAITGGLTASKANELEDNCPDKQCPDAGDKDLKESGENLALATDILLPVGGALAAAGIIMIIIGHSNKDSMESANVSIRPTVLPSAAGLTIEGRF